MEEEVVYAKIYVVPNELRRTLALLMHQKFVYVTHDKHSDRSKLPEGSTKLSHYGQQKSAYRGKGQKEDNRRSLPYSPTLSNLSLRNSMPCFSFLAT